MPLNVRRLPQARTDRLDIWVHIAADNLAAADKTDERLDRAVQLLCNYPESGSNRVELGSDIRGFPVDNFVIYYRLAPHYLEVIRILHAARDVTPDMLA